MKSFRFNLERALEWRQTQLTLVEARVAQQVAALAAIGQARAELDAMGHRADIAVRQLLPLEGGDLGARQRSGRGTGGMPEGTGGAASWPGGGPPPLSPPGAAPGTPLDGVAGGARPGGRGIGLGFLPGAMGAAPGFVPIMK